MKTFLSYLPRVLATVGAAGTALVAANGQPTQQAIGAAIAAAFFAWVNWKPRSSAS